MKKSILIAIVAIVVIVVIAGGYFGYNALNTGQPAASPSPTPAASTATDASDAAMSYIATNHAEIASLTQNLNWTGGRATPEGLVGAETYIYTAENWNVTITYPVVPNPIYTVTAVYTDAVNHVSIEWAGTYQNSTITETSYNYVVP